MLDKQFEQKLEDFRTKGKIIFDVGDIVYLKSDIKQGRPMVVTSFRNCILSEGIQTYCQFFNANGEPVKDVFTTHKILVKAKQKTKKTTKLEILKSKKFDIFGLYNYGSIIAGNFGNEKDTQTAKNSRYIYNFKKYNHSHKEIKENINYVAETFDCESVIAIPSHDKKANYLQKLFGEIIIRINEVEKRKYAHTKELPEDYKNSYNINITKIKGNKILLVDDITTSGRTLLHFKNVFEKMGLEVVCFALGISKKMNPEFYTKIMIIEYEQ